jgi:hypothetical protein
MSQPTLQARYRQGVAGCRGGLLLCFYDLANLSIFRQLAGRGMQRPLNGFGIARDDGEVGFGGLVGHGAGLFP